MMDLRTGVLVVGAGPAGIAAACAAAETGAEVVVLDDNPDAGGQIWRGKAKQEAAARRWIERFENCGARTLSGTRAIGFGNDDHVLLAEQGIEPLRVRFAKLILATGARELFVPFPGWTLPGVAGAGGLQALVQGGLPIANQRVLVAGSGPLLLAVASHLRAMGAQIAAVAEQTPLSSLIRFAAGLAPEKLGQGVRLRFELRGVPMLFSSWPVAAEGNERLRSVEVQTPSGNLRVDCDYLACGFGLVPNTELAQLIGCTLRTGPGRQQFVAVDEWQQTSVRDVLCAGEPTGIGGLEKSLFEGELAGYVATGVIHRIRNREAKRRRIDLFAMRLARAYSLRADLRRLCTRDTIVCRCEDVRFDRIDAYPDWRSAKLATRCGMGPCQGRICGAALAFLKNWPAAARPVRPPVYPASIGALASVTLPETSDV